MIKRVQRDPAVNKKFQLRHQIRVSNSNPPEGVRSFSNIIFLRIFFAVLHTYYCILYFFHALYISRVFSARVLLVFSV